MEGKPSVLTSHETTAPFPLPQASGHQLLLEWLPSQNPSFLQQPVINCCSLEELYSLLAEGIPSFLSFLPFHYPFPTPSGTHTDPELRLDVRWAISCDFIKSITVRFYKMNHQTVEEGIFMETTEGNLTVFSISLPKHLQFKAGETIM